MTKIAIFYPSSSGPKLDLSQGIEVLKKHCKDIQFFPLENPDDWPIYSANEDTRKNLLIEKLLDPSIDVIWFARGGYGASELLESIINLEIPNKKLIIGFSDISAIHSALYKNVNIESIHGAMPGSKLFMRDVNDGTKDLIDLVFNSKETFSIKVNKYHRKVEGTIFGGCFSVLTNLIGTPFFPNLEGHIVFLEDIAENPGKLVRYFDQWIHSGMLKNVEAIVVGSLESCEGEGISYYDIVKRLQSKTEIPIFYTKDFGHGIPNYPIGYGTHAIIENGELTWTRKIS